MPIPRHRRALLAGALLVAGAAVTGSVLAGHFGAPDTESFQADLATGEITRVADIASADGLPGRGVFAQLTEMGQLCLWDALSARSRQRGGGCNPANDPLGGSELSASLAYDGGPPAEAVNDARLIGLTADDVAVVEVLMTDGTRRGVRLGAATVGSWSGKAFGYRFRRSDLRDGVGPVAVLAFDANGKEVARQATGFGG